MIATGLTLIAFFLLAAATSRHAPVLLGGWDAPARRRPLRIAGWLALVLGLAAALAAPDWPIALVGWFAVLPLAAGLILIALTYQRRLAHVSTAIGFALVVAGLIG
jgi:Protein of unknown function (DUF3325)